VGVLATARAQAAGFEVGDIGARALGRGGAFAARADDLTAIGYNPAGLARQPGTRVLASLEMPHASLTFRRAGLDADGQPYPAVSNAAGFGVIPFGAVSSDLGTRDVTFALAAFGPSACGRTSFDSAGPQRFQLVSMDLMLAYYAFAIAIRPRPDLDIGFSLQVGHLLRARVEQGLNAWFGADQGPAAGYDMLARVDFKDAFGVGLLFGALYRPPVQGLTIGLAVRPFPIHFDLSGTVRPEYPGDYLHRLADRGRLYLTDDRVTSSIDLPATARLGVRWGLERAGREVVDVEADLVWEGWSVVDRMEIAFAGDMAFRQDLGSDDLHTIHPVTIPRRWNDTLAVRLGSDVAVVPGMLTVRAGAFYESAAVPQATTSLDFASFQRLGITAGLTFVLKPVDLTVAYAHVFQSGRTVAQGDSDIFEQMPMSPCQAPYTGRGCAERGRPPGPEVGAGSYRSGFDVLSVAIGATFGP
jgi:long-chain fatty acid transport protein